MARVHTGELSAIATKRLQKEAIAWQKGDSALTSEGTISASPHNNDLSTWCANILLCDGPYSGVNFHVYIEIPSNYPAEAPSAYFRSAIAYRNGASYEVPGKGMSICLDLLGNFAFVHTEWATSGEASGWSPSYTISTILITLQGALPEMLLTSSGAVNEAKRSSLSCVCKCGHNGQHVSSYHPALCQPSRSNGKETAAPAEPEFSTATSTASDESKTSSTPPSIEITQLLSKLSKEELKKLILSHVSEEILRKSILPPPLPEIKEETFRQIVCYATGCNPVNDPEEIFGFGIHVSPLTGLLETPAEVLTYSAFESGVKRSTTNQNLDFFLPIFISLPHWRKAREHDAMCGFSLFKKNITQIFAHTTKLAPSQYPTPQIQALMVLCSLMNATCLAAEQAGAAQQTANDRFINGYFTLLRLFKGLANSCEGVKEYADQRIKLFIRSERNRSKHPIHGVPNLGEFLLLLHISNHFNWSDIRVAFSEESDIRRVRWYLKEFPFLAITDTDGPKAILASQRYHCSFDASETSRRLIAFQVKFLLIAKQVSLNSFADGDVPLQLLQRLKNLHHDISKIKDWNDYYQFIDLPTATVEERALQLIHAVKRSEERGYHRNDYYSSDHDGNHNNNNHHRHHQNNNNNNHQLLNRYVPPRQRR